MKFIITVNVETAESEQGPQTPIAAILLTALPLIMDALNIKPPERKPEPESNPESSDTQSPSL